MSDLLSAIKAGGQALNVFGRVIETIQNNLANSTTPGYARQDSVIEAATFDPSNGSVGGIREVKLQNTRNIAAEKAVWHQNAGAQQGGQVDTLLQQITPILGTLDASNTTGISGEMQKLFAAFRSWSVLPNDTATRQTVLEEAGGLADSFRTAASLVGDLATGTRQQVSMTVDAINNVTRQLAEISKEMKSSGYKDPGSEAQFFSKLEELSNYVDFNVSRQSDGSYVVSLAQGKTTLLMGERSFDLSAQFPQPSSTDQYPKAGPKTVVLDASGRDITSAISGGRLGGMLQVATQIVPSLIGDATHQGDLNRLAQAVADRVNSRLTAGQIPGTPPQPGVALFTYDASNPTGVASSMKVNSAIDASKLATTQTQPTTVANGVPSQLAGLGASPDSQDQVDNMNFGAFFSALGVRIARTQSDAQQGETLHKQLLDQAENLRDQSSGVSLEDQAVSLLQFQRSYQAIARVISVLDQLTQTTLGLSNG